MTDPAAAAPMPAKSSLFEDFVDVFISPAKMFARRAGTSPALPYIIVCLLIIGLYFANRNAMSSIMDGEMAKGMEAAQKANPSMTPEQMASGRAIGQTVATFGAIIGVPVALLILGLIAWIVGKILGGTLSYGTALLISAFAWMPRVVESVINTVQGLVLDTTKMTSHYQLQLGPSRFLDPVTTPTWQLALLGRVDLITLWVTVLFAIGLVYAGKVDRGKIVLAGILMWVIGSLPAFWQALRG
jgi:hypothetical protein